MGIVAQLRSLTHEQRSAVLASFLGWTLDAFDFFLLVFVIKDIATEFHSDVEKVTFAILLTLALAWVAGVVAVLAWFGRERKGVSFTGPEAARP